ncbi:FRG domain-containing protein [Noviherbaspirillum agri]
MSIPQAVIRNVGDLSREIRALDANERWLYRGQPDARWSLAPSVHRGYTPQQERYLTNEFRVRARSRHLSCPADNDYPSWLALMQHYGLPTRLLDWTHSPLVAAYFAVHPEYTPHDADTGRDACIWALAAGKLNQAQGFEPLIFPLDAASYEALIVPAFKNRDEPGTVGVAMAIEHDARIQLQQAAFTVHSNRTPIDRLPGADTWLHKLVIPNDSICDFFEELSVLGMKKSNLFPDLPSLASELKLVH